MFLEGGGPVGGAEAKEADGKSKGCRGGRKQRKLCQLRWSGVKSFHTDGTCIERVMLELVLEPLNSVRRIPGGNERLAA
eukprot:1160954-Pelagomonas_calceolata.AAC.3